MMTEREHSRSNQADQPQTLSRVARSQAVKATVPSRKPAKAETEQVNTVKQDNQSAEHAKQKKPKREGRHKGWVWFARLIIPFLCIAALITGMYIGYAVIGGEDASDVWNLDTWRHVFDLVFKD